MFKALRRKRWIRLKQKQIAQLISSYSDESLIKLNIGSGTKSFEGWINLDLPYFDLRTPKNWTSILGNKKFSCILLEHVLEHLDENDVKLFLKIAKTHMNENSRIRIAVPDKNHPNPAYIDYVRPGGWGVGSDDHKSFWSYDSFKKLAKSAGYKIVPYEYWHENSTFHTSKMDESLGVVNRRAEKIKNHTIEDYSSLIFDLTL